MKNNSILKWLLVFSVFGICIITAPQYAACSEEYYINNNRVLLYKIINWWYDSLPEESYLLCGKRIRCHAKGNIQIEYIAGEMKLRFITTEGFADLLSIFKQCEQCWGPSYFKLTWLNKKFLENGKFIGSADKVSSLNSYVFARIDRAAAQRINRIANDLGLELEGVICGLMNGRIALHHSGKRLKTCPVASSKQDEFFPIELKIVNYQTGEILAKLSAVFDDKNHNKPFAAEHEKSPR